MSVDTLPTDNAPETSNEPKKVLRLRNYPLVSSKILKNTSKFFTKILKTDFINPTTKNFKPLD